MPKPASGRWLSFPPSHGSARGVALCFPFAGGGASFYRAWAPLVPPSIVLWPVQLPGREERFFETPYDSMRPLVDAAASELQPLLPERYVLFGHSMGALVAYELAHALRGRGARPPLHLFVSGAPAPHRAAESERIYDLPEDEFVPALTRYGGLPEDVLRSSELMALLIPRLRADLAVTGTYIHTERPPLPYPITAFGGDADPTVSVSAVEAWREHTTDRCDVEILPGGHFFLTGHLSRIIERVAAALR